MRLKYSTMYHPAEEYTNPAIARKKRHKTGNFSQLQDILADGEEPVTSVEPSESPPQKRRIRSKSSLSKVRMIHEDEPEDEPEGDAFSPPRDASPESMPPPLNPWHHRSTKVTKPKSQKVRPQAHHRPSIVTSLSDSSTLVGLDPSEQRFSVRRPVTYPFELYCQQYTQKWEMLATLETVEERTSRFAKHYNAAWQYFAQAAIDTDAEPIEIPDDTASDGYIANEGDEGAGDGSEQDSSHSVGGARLPRELEAADDDDVQDEDFTTSAPQVS